MQLSEIYTFVLTKIIWWEWIGQGKTIKHTEVGITETHEKPLPYHSYRDVTNIANGASKS